MKVVDYPLRVLCLVDVSSAEDVSGAHATSIFRFEVAIDNAVVKCQQHYSHYLGSASQEKNQHYL
jgi:hypothetical protein